MTSAARFDPLPQLWTVLGSPRFGAALATTSVAASFLAVSIQRTMGLAALVTIVAGLAVLNAGTALARRREISWQGILPVSLIAFCGWAALTIVWSQYQWATAGGLAYLAAFTVMGVSLSLARDLIQVVRAYGDALRFVLGLSLAVEILAGVLLDTALPFLGVEGDLAQLGPIQGLLGSRNQFAIVALIALVTFGVEFLTRSVGRSLGIGSLVLAALCLLLTRSPVGLGLLLVVGLAVLAVALVRRAPAERRQVIQLALVGLAAVLAIVAWITRSRIVDALSGNAELSYRLELWGRAFEVVRVHQLEGWGWIGRWRPEWAPFAGIGPPGEREPISALNAYLDVWLQLGIVGLFIFLVLVLLAFTRSWLLAGRSRPIVYTWPALVLVILIVSSLAESSVLVEYGWMTFVLCAVKAAEQLSWRRALVRHTAPDEG